MSQKCCEWNCYILLFISVFVATRCQYVPLDCDYRYYVAVNQTDGTTLPIHVEYPPGEQWEEGGEIELGSEWREEGMNKERVD